MILSMALAGQPHQMVWYGCPVARLTVPVGPLTVYTVDRGPVARSGCPVGRSPVTRSGCPVDRALVSRSTGWPADRGPVARSVCPVGLTVARLPVPVSRLVG